MSEVVERSTAMEKLSEPAEVLFNSYVKSWKDQGKKVMGYTGLYIPEEIIYAAGILPFRLRGTGATKTTGADSWYGPVNCSFAKCCLELVIDGDYDFLDGGVISYECDHMHRLYDTWRVGAPDKVPPFFHYYPLGHTMHTENGLKLFTVETLKFIKHLEEQFGAKITEEGLKDAIAVYNETRNLLHKLYDLRIKDEVPITGTETLGVIVAAVSMWRGEYNRLLRELIDDLGETEGISCSDKPRLMIVGSVNDDPALVKLIEDAGSVVVADSLCLGARYFWDLVEEEGDPLHDILTRYLNNIPCPRMFGHYSERWQFLIDTAKRANVDGVILENIRFCDMHGADNTLFENDLKKEGIPSVNIEREYGPLSDAGRIRTRVQAFLEAIKR